MSWLLQHDAMSYTGKIQAAQHTVDLLAAPHVDGPEIARAAPAFHGQPVLRKWVLVDQAPVGRLHISCAYIMEGGSQRAVSRWLQDGCRMAAGLQVLVAGVQVPVTTLSIGVTVQIPLQYRGSDVI